MHSASSGLQYGPALKVTIHLNEDASSDRDFTYQQVFQFLFDKGVAGASLIRPQESFGAHHQLHTREGYGGERRHLPVQVQFIETAETVNELLPQLCEIVRDGLVEMQETTIIKRGRQEEAF